MSEPSTCKMSEPSTCFICLNKFNNDNYNFNDYVLNNMPCDCYRKNLIHEDCFNTSFKLNEKNINHCLLCRTYIETCIQHPDYELSAVIDDYKKLQYIQNQTLEICLAAVNKYGYD